MSKLADFVLDSIRQAGGIVEPPTYGVYEVLLPEEAARDWNAPSYQRLAFTDEAATEMLDDARDVAVIGYAHPLVEALMEESRADPACALVYADGLQLDKIGLLSLAREKHSLLNARLTEAPDKSARGATCHYVRFNFKAALLTDEKRERLISVMMNAQGGFSVPELVHIERKVRLKEEPAFKHLLPAPIHWLPGHQALDLEVLEELLERAKRAALDELAAPLERLRNRAARHLELARARLTEYYDDLSQDLQKRIERSSSESRITSLEEKLATAQVEREAKLADVEAKYRLRVELELINLQVIVQPKLVLPVQIGDRNTKIERTIFWDPLLHRIEPLTCDVCGRPATRLMLCSGGHLAHEECLLDEQCVDCKRLYCRLCAEQMGRCVVCNRPVCLHSLNRCDECGRGTCREHVGLCHAADGEPAPPPREEEVEEERVEEEKEVVEKEPPPPAPAEKEDEEQPAPGPSKEEKRRRAERASRKSRRSAKKRSRGPRPYKIEVYVEPDIPVVSAFVLTKGQKRVAVRTWELAREGIVVNCRCEKWYSCPVNGTVLEPADASGIEAQIERQIEELRQEYHISSRRVFRFAQVRSAMRQVTRVGLRGEWKAER